MGVRTQQDWRRWIRVARGIRGALARAARQLCRRLLLACTLVVLLTLLVPINGGIFDLGGISAALARGPKPNHEPQRHDGIRVPSGGRCRHAASASANMDGGADAGATCLFRYEAQ